MKEVIFTGMLTDSDSLGFRDNLELASHLVCADHCFKDNPTTCYKSTLHCSSGGRFCLETMVLWEDSLISPNFRRLMDPTHRVFSKYVLERERQSVSAHADRLCGWQERDLSARRTWSPRDFYNNVYVPPDTPDTSAEIKGDLIESRLYPFQRRAVRWLLEREGVRQLPDGRVVPNESLSSDQLPPSFEEMTDVYGRTFFFSPLYMVVTTDLGGWPDAERNVLGGILAEEMGLGKTVEMISLICLNRRPNLMDQTRRIDSHGLRFSGATLIITPPTILEQWKQEISLHAPALRVFHYSGFQSHKGLSEQDLIERMSDHDIVLTTYNVLAREVYHSGDAPKRNLRHAKRFEFRKTPLVLVSWWRVCLDEAQMIESGVSNAARVARLIPRQIAWAVTGTPIRKDISDLFGLLLFLDYQPFCKGDDVWARLCHSFHYILARMVNTITIRHNKDHVRSELDLPRQKRVVITIPFTAIEEQHYGQLYEQMCEECGLDTSGAPLAGDWNPDDPYTIDRMRNWLSRLRQTCLHPEVAGSNRRALGTGSGPLRSVDEVLEVMIDQNDTLIRAEERAFLLSQLRRGQMLENATRRREAFDLWKASLDRASEIVKECMHQLHLERTKIAADGFGRDTPAVDASDNEDGEKFSRLGTNRQRLRAALEVQHICQFFIGNAYYQIKSDPKLTEPDSEEFASLEESEGQAYEAAKLIRKEMLVDVSQKVGRLMEVLKDKGRKGRLVHIPRMKPHLYSMGLESRRVLEKLEDFCEAMNAHAAKYNEWRGIMAKLLTLSLIDQEEDAELEGNEYEKSTKHQDEMYVYMEALRTMFADRHDALTGQKNVLIAREVKGGILQAQKGEGPSPALFLSIMNTRSEIMPDPELGSLRGIISELRSLVTSLEWQASGGSSRARSELELVNSVFSNASQMAAEQGKAVSNLEREVEMFRNTMNSRLEYYRQLQQISDTVAPYDEESAGKPLDEEVYSSKCKQEGMIDGKIAGLKAKRRYLIHLRDESGSDDGSKICVVCQSSFEIGRFLLHQRMYSSMLTHAGVLTVCGHKYCKDCLRIWWNQHRTCPTCKMRLRVNDFHQITYKPQEIVAQEETAPTKERASENLIYSDVSSGLLREIKDIDLDWSFGTKIDTLARHIMWLREHDPGAKAVVFSQYKSFLGVLGGAFSRFKIGHSSVDNKDGIESFKRDPAVSSLPSARLESH